MQILSGTIKQYNQQVTNINILLTLAFSVHYKIQLTKGFSMLLLLEKHSKIHCSSEFFNIPWQNDTGYFLERIFRNTEQKVEIKALLALTEINSLQLFRNLYLEKRDSPDWFPLLQEGKCICLTKKERKEKKATSRHLPAHVA